MKTQISKFIEIDAGHRVPDHHSKCRSIHGHRYKVEAVMEGDLHTEGSQNGMVLDFGFLKEFLVTEVDQKCDHAFLLYMHDYMLMNAFLPNYRDYNVYHALNCIKEMCGYNITSDVAGKVFLTNFIPTAENLAKYWFELIQHRWECSSYYTKNTRLLRVKVNETPTSYAVYPG